MLYIALSQNHSKCTITCPTSLTEWATGYEITSQLIPHFFEHIHVVSMEGTGYHPIDVIYGETNDDLWASHVVNTVFSQI